MVLPEGVPLQGAVADILVRAAEAAKPLCPRGDPLFRWARGRSSRTSPRTVVQARFRTASRCGMVLSEMKDITIAEHPPESLCCIGVPAESAGRGRIVNQRATTRQEPASPNLLWAAYA